MRELHLFINVIISVLIDIYMMKDRSIKKMYNICDQISETKTNICSIIDL